MAHKPMLIYPDGRPIPPARRGAMALNGSSHPYQAADWRTQEMESWRAMLLSPDIEINPARDTIVARTRDWVRNDGYGAGAITHKLDTVIGGDYRLQSKPDWKALRQISGASYDAVWADEYGRAVEAYWRPFAYDVGRYCDLERRLTFPQMMYLALRHRFVDGESIKISHWRPDRLGPGRARYATCFQVVDPDRLSNPANVFDTQIWRGGVQIDLDGAVEGYHFREAHPGDWFDAARANTWKYLPRETKDGRPIVIHAFKPDRAQQHRAAGGIFTPILARMRMLAKYDSTELAAAIVNAIFAAYIESPYDPADVEAAVSGDTEISRYQRERNNFHDERALMAGGVKVPTLFPGEKVGVVNAARPSSNFEAFESAILRHGAVATGMTTEQFSGNWSNSNYSSARGALMDVWKAIDRERRDFNYDTATPCYANWLEEAHERDPLPLPAGAIPFQYARSSYANAHWSGAPRGWIDPVKESQGAAMRMQMGVSTFEQEAWEQGRDWEDQMDQLAIEAARRRQLGLPPVGPMGAAKDTAQQDDVRD